MMKSLKKQKMVMKLIPNNITLFFIGLFFASCETKVNHSSTENSIINHLKNDSNKKAKAIVYNQAKSILQNGDIVLRTGNDVISSLFAQLNKSDKTYSHCGIALNENNTWYVYHSIGGEDNPDEKLRKDLFEKFVSYEHNIGFGICRYPISKNDQKNIETTLIDFHAKEVPFDMKFDLQSDNRLYCAEMIYKVFNKALDTSHFFQTTIHKGFEYVSTDNLFVNNKAEILCHIVY